MESISYGNCPCREGDYNAGTVEVRFSDPTLVLTDVPQGACPHCGSRVYKTEVLEVIEAIMKSDRSTVEAGSGLH